MQVVNESSSRIVLQTDAAQKAQYPKQGRGCAGIVFGFTLVSILLFILFAYPHYHTSHAWLFWIVTLGILLAESFVIYLAIFVSRAVNHGAGKQ